MQRKYRPFYFPRTLFSIALLALAIYPDINRSSVLYTMKDLEILEAEKNYSEFFLHARDIRPGLRNQHWNEMVANMAESYISPQLTQHLTDKKTFDFVEELYSWPVLQKHEFFSFKRDQLGANYFKSALRDKKNIPTELEELLNSMVRFWLKNPANPNLGLELAELADQHDKEELIDHWPFISTITTGSYASPFCKKKLVQKHLFKELLEILSKSAETNQNEQKILALIGKKMSEQCWESFLPVLQKGLFETKGQNQQNLYTLLEIKKALPAQAKDYYHTLYILNAPIQGKVFNQAWNTIKELGQNYKRRMSILDNLKKLEQLPDGLFSLHDASKKEIIIGHFAQNFPEYLDYYGKNCVNFLAGRKTFPSGNPTLYCRDLFQSPKIKEWVSSSLLQDYQNIPKLN